MLNGYYLGVTLFVSASEKLTQLGLMSGTLQNGTILDKSLAENIYKTFKDCEYRLNSIFFSFFH